MTPDMMKISAAVRALAFVEPGMRLGLGTGSTALEEDAEDPDQEQDPDEGLAAEEAREG